MNYIVMECHPGFAVLLDEDGRFVKAANLHYEVGDTVTNPVLMQDVHPQRRRNASLWAYAAGVMAACLTLVLGLLLYQTYTTPVSSILLRINPEVRLDLSRTGKVVSADALNDEGILLLDGYDFRGKDSVTVSEELIDRAIERGYLAEGGKVTFSIDTPDQDRFEAYGAALRQGVTDHLSDRMSITIEVYDSPTLPDEAPLTDKDKDDDDSDNDDDDDDDDDHHDDDDDHHDD